jgi:oligo-1,6-glucosidase
VYGNFTLLSPEDDKVFAFKRELEEGGVAFIALNFSTSEVSFDTAEVKEFQNKAKLTLSNYEPREGTLSEKLTLRPYEGRVYLA